LEDAAGHRSVVLTADLLGFPRNMYDHISGELKSRCNLQRAEVILNCSHTHCGPVLRGALYDIYPLDDRQRAMIEEYSAGLEKTVVKTIAEALADLRPATLSAAQGFCPFAVNRRENTEDEVIQLRAAGQPTKGPSDRAVPVLAVRSSEGSLLAVLFGYACHNTTLSDYQWCGDYAGFAQIALEKEHSGTQMMFFQGCGADQNPLPRRSVELCQKYGQSLADSVEKVLAGPMKPLAPRLQTAFQFITLDFGQMPTRADLEGMLKKTGYEARWAKRLLAELDAGKSFEKAYPAYPVQVWKLGDQLWITLGGEVVVDYALKLKAKYGTDTWIAGYTNDDMAYIPSRRVWEEGRYESGAFGVYGLPALRWTPEIEDRILGAVDRLVQQLKSE
jgi:hypothetical protein